MSPFNLFRKKTAEPAPSANTDPAQGKPATDAQDSASTPGTAKAADGDGSTVEPTAASPERTEAATPASASESTSSKQTEATVAKAETQSPSPEAQDPATAATASAVPTISATSAASVAAAAPATPAASSQTPSPATPEQTAFFRKAAPIISVELDGTGAVLSADSSLTSTFGWEPREIAGKHLRELIKPSTDAALDEFLRTLNPPNKETRPAFFLTGVRKDTTEFPAFVTFCRDNTGADSHWVAMFQPIAEAVEQKPIQKRLLALLGSQANLERRLTEVTRSRDDLLNLLKGSSMVGGVGGSPQSLDNASDVTHKLEALVQQESQRSQQYQAEIERLQKVSDELSQKLATEEQAVVESKRCSESLEEKLLESNRTLKELEAKFAAQVSEHQQQEAELRQKLTIANTANEKLLKAFRERSEECMQTFDQVSALRKSREELAPSVEKEQQKLEESRKRCEELEQLLQERNEQLAQAKEESEKHIEQHGRPNQALNAQLTTAENSLQDARKELDEEVNRRNGLERQLADLSKSQAALNESLTQREKECQELRRHSRDLEKRLEESAQEMQKVKGELDDHAQERQRLETQLRDQLTNAKANLEEVQADYHEQTGFYTRSATEASALRDARDKLDQTLAAEREAAEQSKRYITELEQRLSERSAELDRVRGELEQQIAGRATLESEFQNLAQANATLKTELTSLKPAEQAAALGLSPDANLDEATVSRLARLTADLDHERGQRRRAEQRAASAAAQLKNLHEDLQNHLEIESDYQKKLHDLEQQLGESRSTLERTKEDWQKEASERQLAEDQLTANEEIGKQLKQHSNALNEAKQLLEQSQQAQEKQEARLKESLQKLQESQNRLQKEIADKQKLEETLQDLQARYDEQSQKSAMELTKIKSALQVETLERQRLENQILESRHSELTAARAKRASIAGFRKQLQSPLDHLLAATRRLLESELAADDKQLAESALENAFRLQHSMQNETTGDSDSASAQQDSEPTAKAESENAEESKASQAA